MNENCEKLTQIKKMEDDNIRKDIKQEIEREKKLEEQIKTDLEELESWWEIECKVYEEKQRRLKIYWDELRTQKSKKSKELRDLYGLVIVEKVRRKYKIKL